jgi:hypothetical protein
MMNTNTAHGGNQFNPSGTVPLPITTVDAFTAARGIKVDFIKSDIEGMERFLLNGAKETLARDGPKLSIRTYHFYDDRQLLPSIVKKANPKYKIVYGRNCFYAWVP